MGGRLSKEDIERMVNEAEKYKEEDKVANAINASDKATLIAKCDEVISWLDSNQTAEKEEYEFQKKELEKVANPIMTKLYQGAGGAPGGMPGGGAPGAAPGGEQAGGSAGPTIEEVD